MLSMNAEADLSEAEKLSLKPLTPEMTQCQPLFPGSKNKTARLLKEQVWALEGILPREDGGHSDVASGLCFSAA